MMDDSELLREYARTGSEQFFTELVSRHLPLVYSAALRQVGGDHDLAKDVAQNVFIDLAGKAKSLARHEVLTGWLYTSTRFAAGTVRRSEQRRQTREQIAAAMQALESGAHPNREWERITPLLDEMMHELSPEDRIAVLLRFFENKDHRQIGRALGVSDDAARMRVNRALEKLHSLLTARGVTISGAALATLLTSNAIQAIPVGLAAGIAGASLSAAASGTSIIQTLLHAARAKWMIVGVPGMMVVLLALSSYVKTRSSEVAPETLAQFNSAPATPDSSGPSFEEASAPAVASSVNSTLEENQMQFQLLDAETGEPISSAKLRAHFFGTGDNMPAVRLSTDAEGKADLEFPNKPLAGANLFVTAENHVPKVVSWRSAPRPKNYTMKLESGSTISGVVVDENQQPVAQAVIEFESPGNDMAQKENIQFGPDTLQTTDAHGRWSCNMIPRSYETLRVMLTHPEFAPTPTEVSVNTEPATNQVLQIRRGITVRGIVTDATGQPIGEATVRQIHNGMGPVFSATTDAAGRFEIKNLPAGDTMFAIQAQGLAPEVLETNLSASPTEIAIVLQPGYIFKGRVVDESGTPIANAIAKTDWDNQGLRKIEWSARTDHEGRFEWDSAPAEALLYWFEAEDFDWSRGMLLKADGSDHEIKLARKGGPTETAAVKITGTATDEETGLPLDEFKVLLGEVFGLPMEPEFHYRADGKDGKFSLSLSRPYTFGAYQVQLEKDGYLPIACTNLFVKDGNQSLHLKMHKGSGPSGTVVLPSGEPAIDTTVFLYEARGGVYMDKPGKYRKDLEPNTPTHAQTDAQGKFSFAPKLQAKGLIVIHDQGYAELPLNAFRGTIVAQPWGRVEGKLTVSGRPAPNETISLENVLYRHSENDRMFPALSLWLKAKTDADGNFAFEKVPPGERKITRRLSKPGSKIGPIYETHAVPVTVSPGEVTRVELGGTGRPIIGKIAHLPEALTPGAESVTIELRLKVPGLDPNPPDCADYPTMEAFLEASRAFAEANQKFWSSTEGRELERSQRSYSAFCSEDGSFVLPDIPSGTYELKIETVRGIKNSVGPSQALMGGTPISLLVKEVVVPEMTVRHDENPLDLGVLDLSTGNDAAQR